MSASDLMTIGQTLKAASQALTEAGCATPALDARLLLAHAVGLERDQIVSNSGQAVDDKAQKSLCAYLLRRKTGEPVYRILGYREFYGHRFEFGPGVLEPRAETELLVEAVLEDFTPEAKLHFAEIGIGSGAIAISLLKALTGASAMASDIALEPLVWAKKNAQRLGVADRLRLAGGDCLEAIDGQFDFIISNPPYIANAELDKLAVEVRDFDPKIALDGGSDGLEIIARILAEAPQKLKKGGRLYLETGHGQHSGIGELAKKAGWKIIRSGHDFSNLERFVVLQSGK